MSLDSEKDHGRCLIRIIFQSLDKQLQFIWQLSFLCQQLCNTKGLQKASCTLVIFFFSWKSCFNSRIFGLSFLLFSGTFVSLRSSLCSCSPQFTHLSFPTVEEKWCKNSLYAGLWFGYTSFAESPTISGLRPLTG